MSVSSSLSETLSTVYQSRLLTIMIPAFLLSLSAAYSLLLSLFLLIGGRRIGIGTPEARVSPGLLSVLALVWAPTCGLSWALFRAFFHREGRNTDVTS